MSDMICKNVVEDYFDRHHLSPLPLGGGLGRGQLLTRIEKARELRRNQTPSETLVWSALRRRQLDGHHFRRQYPRGPYIFDFVCLAAKLVVEIDGPSHDQTVEYDSERTRYMEHLGFKVIRFSNEDVRRNLQGVAETIRQVLNGEMEER